MSVVTDRLCAACGTAPATAEKPSRIALARAKYCTPCRAQRRRRPPSTVTAAQGAEIARGIGVLSRQAIADRLGVSRAAVARYTRDHGLYGHSDAYPPDVVAAVCAAYEAAPQGLGKARVQELFPAVAGRSIVERYKHFRPRQIRWTAAQLREAAKMAGLVSQLAQARFFGRPYAFDGSIRTLWRKRFRCAPGNLNGLNMQLAWWLGVCGCPAVLVAQGTQPWPRAKVLWLDLAAWLPAEMAPEIARAVRALAAFQTWLHGTSDAAEVRAMITEREQHGDHVLHARERVR